MTDLTGQKFGILKVIERLHTNGKNRFYKVICLECNIEKVVMGSNLKNGSTRSCGCKKGRRDFKKDRIAQEDRHRGNSCTKLYKKWSDIKRRVDNKSHPDYHRYGGRGIKLYRKWYDFEVFKAYIEKTIGLPKRGQSIDRKYNNKGYVPRNIRWSNSKTNSNNRENTVCIVYKGKKLAISEVYRKLNVIINYDTFVHRVFKKEWDIKRAAYTPTKNSKNPSFYFHPHNRYFRSKSP